MAFLKKVLIVPALLCLAVGCAYDSHREPLASEFVTVVPNTDIGSLPSMCADGVHYVYDEIIVGGYVTANDKSGNIYRSFFIDDGSGALEIRAGMYSLHNVYQRGRYVSVRLQGLAAALNNGVLQVGFPPSEGYSTVDYLDSWIVASLYLFPESETENTRPVSLDISQLAEDVCGRVVRLSDLRLVTESEDEEQSEHTGFDFERSGVTWAIPRDKVNTVPQSRYLYFEDGEGRSIAVYTSGYADFAGERVPPGRINLTGILSYGSPGSGSPVFILRLRDSDDINSGIF